ncbi:MAG: hypothetical protein ACP5QW_07655, partial [bacterium]
TLPFGWVPHRSLHKLPYFANAFFGLNDFELEKIERQYFDLILIHLKQDLNTLIVGLNSRIKILNNWYDNFIKTARSGYKASAGFPN